MATLSNQLVRQLGLRFGPSTAAAIEQAAEGADVVSFAAAVTRQVGVDLGPDLATEFIAALNDAEGGVTFSDRLSRSLGLQYGPTLRDELAAAVGELNLPQAPVLGVPTEGPDLTVLLTWQIPGGPYTSIEIFRNDASEATFVSPALSGSIPVGVPTETDDLYAIVTGNGQQSPQSNVVQYTNPV